MEEVCISLEIFVITFKMSFSPQGCEAEKGSEASPSFGYPKTCQECWQTEVQKVSCVK